MVILDAYGKIEKTLISKKLHLYIDNIPNSESDNWNEYICQIMEREIREQEFESAEYKLSYGKNLDTFDTVYFKEIFRNNFNHIDMNDEDNTMLTEYIQIVADNMICLFFDYSYEDMPFFDWTTNCFDGRLCEEDYAEKIVKLMQLCQRNNTKFTPNIIYTSNEDFRPTKILQLLKFKKRLSLDEYISELIIWGRKLDDFLESENDYYKLDYIANSIYMDKEYNSNHLFKNFALLELLLLKPNEKTNEIDKELTPFLVSDYGSESENVAILLRQMRNKIGHGDFLAFNKKIEEFISKYMSDYHFDYTEYSRLNWGLLNVCCLLDEILAKVLSIKIS